MSLNLSALGFILFPLLGIVIPLIMWISKKGKLKQLDNLAKEVLNFQISWTIVLLLTYIYFIASTYYRLNQTDYISLSILGNPVYKLLAMGGLYVYNFILIIVNTLKLKDGREVRYFPRIRFVR